MSAPIRVTLVRVGGWERWVETVATYLARSGFAVRALVFEPGAAAPAAPEGVQLVHERVSGGRLRRTLDTAARLRRHLSASPPELVYLVDSWSIPAFWLATRGRLRWGSAPLVYQTFEWLDPAVHGPLRTRMERTVCRRAARVVNVDRVRGRAQQLVYGLERTPRWLRNSLPRDYPVPAPSPERRRELLGEAPPAGARAVFAPSIASPSRMSLELIRAVAGMPEDVRLAMVAGSGPYFEACRAEAVAAGCARRVTFLPSGSFERMMEYVVCADVGVAIHDAGSKSFGDFAASPARLSMFAAAGVPLLGTDLPTVAADVYAHGLGTCCDASRPDDIRRGLSELLASPEPPAERSSRIRRIFVERWCFEAGAEGFGAELARMVRGEAGPG